MEAISISNLIACCQICGTAILSKIPNNLLAYLARDRGVSENFLYDKCYELLEKRTPWENWPRLNYSPREFSIFRARCNLIISNNIAYEIATTPNPSAHDLETFAGLHVCWSLLFPVKAYLLDHPEIAKQYRSFMPFGSEVIKFYNKVMPQGYCISGSPNFVDHVRLKELTNKYADLTGMTGAVLNTVMYLEGLQ